MAAQLKLVAVSEAGAPPVGWTENSNRLVSLVGACDSATQTTDSELTHTGLSQRLARNLTPPPQVLEQLPYELQVPQPPSCLRRLGVNFMQKPLKQCFNETQVLPRRR